MLGGVFFFFVGERERESGMVFFFFFSLTKEALESELDGTYRGNKMTNLPSLMLEIDRFMPRIFLLISLPFNENFDFWAWLLFLWGWCMQLPFEFKDITSKKKHQNLSLFFERRKMVGVDCV